MKRLVFLLCMTLLGMMQADTPKESFKQGKSMAQERLNEAAPSFDPSLVPNYQGTPSISTEGLMERGQSALNTSAAGQCFMDAQNQHFDIAPEDPMIAQAQRIQDNPTQTIQVVAKSTSHSRTEKRTYTCLDGGSPFERTCHRRLIIKLKITPPVYGTRFTSCPGHKHGMFNKYYHGEGCQNPVQYIITPKKVEVVEEYWADTCGDLESMTDHGQCHYASLQKHGINETRMIQDEPITRPHFEETRVYQCRSNPTQGCALYKNRGCLQIKSECVEKDAVGMCKTYRQTYVCEETTQRFHHRFEGPDKPFCLDGHCMGDEDEKSEDLLNALTQLKVLEEMGKYKAFGQSLMVFSGKVMRCSKNPVDFKDCCRCGKKGWGQSLGLAGCKAEEIALAKERMAGKCVLVGTYCAKKVLGVCVSKKTSFVCFPSKLSRLIQEQGRRQLGLSFGSPKEPCARGLSVDEMSRLNFDAMDFREVFSEIQASVKIPQTKALEAKVRSRITQLKSDFSLPTSTVSGLGDSPHPRVQKLKETMAFHEKESGEEGDTTPYDENDEALPSSSSPSPSTETTTTPEEETEDEHPSSANTQGQKKRHHCVVS